MNRVAREWIEKAEADFRTAQPEFRARAHPNYDAVCFHAQQAVEKLMKARLVTLRRLPAKTHDLQRLSRSIRREDESWSWPAADLRFLSKKAIDFRYPGHTADREVAARALSLARDIRDRLLSDVRENG